MTVPQTLHELYLNELCALRSENAVMAEALASLCDRVGDGRLKAQLSASLAGIERQSALLRDLVEEAGGVCRQVPSVGMAALSGEVQALVQSPGAPDEVVGLAALAGAARMNQLRIAGLGLAAGYARALGLSEAAGQLLAAAGELRGCDAYMSDLIEANRARRLAAA